MNLRTLTYIATETSTMKNRTFAIFLSVFFALSGLFSSPIFAQSDFIVKDRGFSLIASADSPSPLTYAWCKNGQVIAGATNSTYEVSTADASHAGDYHCIVSNVAGSAQSNTLSLTVTGPPSNPRIRIEVKKPPDVTVIIEAQKGVKFVTSEITAVTRR